MSDQIPKWAEELIESNKQLEQRIDALKSSTSGTRRQMLEEKLKDVPEKLRQKALKDFSRMKFDTDDDFEAYLDETSTDLSEFAKEPGEQSPASMGKPSIGGNAPAGAKSQQDISSWAKDIETGKHIPPTHI